VFAIRFQCYGVVDFRFADRNIQTAKLPVRRLAPAQAVVLGHHRPAPIKLALRRDLVLEVDPEGDFVATNQVTDFSRRHVIAEAGDAAALFGLQSPQRAGNTRHQYKQYQH